MIQTSSDEQMQAYSAAVQSGLYDKKSGLTGKYDNVRRYWEDEVTRHFLRPHLDKLISKCREHMRRVRVLDLGCGSADGYELLKGVRRRDPGLCDVEVDLLTPDMLGAYKGVDLNDDLLDQARAIYGNNPKISFEQGDFADGLPLRSDERPFDLYFHSFGTCSHHNEDESFIRLLSQIADRTEDYALVACDWLGRYSYEWQTLWTNDLTEHRNMDYVVSYIYDEQEREARRAELQHLTLRLMSRQEAEGLVQEAARRAGVAIRPLAFYDRSTFTGRHMDTGEYNPHAQPLRAIVNSLHEANVRTDLQSVCVNYVPKAGFEFVNDYFERLQMAWNFLVHHVVDLLETHCADPDSFEREAPRPPASCPAELRAMMERMRRVVAGVGWLDIGLPRENIIEPQLGYALRHLAMSFQQGQGCAHGLVAVLEIDKRAS